MQICCSSDSDRLISFFGKYLFKLVANCVLATFRDRICYKKYTNQCFFISNYALKTLIPKTENTKACHAASLMRTFNPMKEKLIECWLILHLHIKIRRKYVHSFIGG